MTPGQGQTVRVSGVEVGRSARSSLNNGIAIVQMDINDKYKHLIHTDATALLRPRTGLKDMFIELNPGSKNAPMAKPGFTIPVSNTLPDINVDEILASLDSDTRAYLDLLVNGAGHGPARVTATSWPRCSSASSPPTGTWRASTRPSRSAGPT